MTSNTIPKALFIGRWQPFHKGHEWLIDQKLILGTPVLIAIRDVQPDKDNPLNSSEVLYIITKRYEDLGDMVKIIIIPDIESVNYGRGVGYQINELNPPKDIYNISATEIRKRIRNNDETWKEFINPSIHSIVKTFLK